MKGLNALRPLSGRIVNNIIGGGIRTDTRSRNSQGNISFKQRLFKIEDLSEGGFVNFTGREILELEEQRKIKQLRPLKVGEIVNIVEGGYHGDMTAKWQRIR